MADTHDIAKVGVIGSGAWGTALAVLANRASSKVMLWSRNQNVVDQICRKRVNDAYLPDIFVDPAIHITSDLAEVCRNDILLLVVPAQYLRSICIAISDLVPVSVPIVSCTKGIERGSLAIMSEIISSILPHNPVAVLSGPNFANEAARGLPTATTIACKDFAVGQRICQAVGVKYFRPYITDDLIGAQIGGAVKNVIAIACGIAVAKNLGENARAALITRGLAEMTRLCAAKDGRIETLMGLSGIGDLMLTCQSIKSRNMAFGYALGLGKRPDDILHGERHGVVEGVATAESVTELAQKLGVFMPICNAIQGILSGKTDVDGTIRELLERPFVAEGSFA